MKERLTAHDQDNTLILNYYKDMEPCLQYATDARRVEAEQTSRKSEFRHVMRVEPEVILAVCNKLGIQYANAFDKEYSQRVWDELKRPEFKNFRTVNDKRL
jgi:hypothetical protein